MVYIAVGRAVTIKCDSCGFKLQAQGDANDRAAVSALGWETVETDRCPTCVEAKRRLDEEAAFIIADDRSPNTDNYLIWSDEHGTWRGRNGIGYTRDSASAGRYGREAAIKVCRNALPVDLVTLVAFPEIVVHEVSLMSMSRVRPVKIRRGGRVYEVGGDEGPA
jgi:hypothetical protein